MPLLRSKPVPGRPILGKPVLGSMRSAIVLATLLAVSSAASARAAEYFVAPSGSDANPGTAAQPWATLQHAADAVAPGDTVTVRGGSYTGAQFTTSGTALQPIVFRVAEGEEARIVADNPSTPDGLNIEGADHMVLDGFRVDGRTRAGIRAVLCEHVVIRNNRAHGNGRWGILTGFCDDIVIEDNVTTGSLDEHGIYFSNSGDRPILRRNRIYGNRANGIHMNGDRFAGGDGVISNALVEDNVIFDNGVGGGSGINCDGVQNSIIRNNLIYDTHASGISLYQIDGGAPSTGNRVLHNTVLVASDGRWAMNIQDGSSGNTLVGNVFYSRHGFRGAIDICQSCLPGLVSNQNVLEDRMTTDGGNTLLDLEDWQNLTGGDGDSVATADPDALFVDSAGGDFHLAPGSLALDLADVLGDVPTDLDGTARPIGPRSDAGAYEGVGVLFADGFEAGTTLGWSSSSG